MGGKLIHDHTPPDGRGGGGQTTGGYKGRTQEVTEGVYGGGGDHGRNLDRKGKGI